MLLKILVELGDVLKSFFFYAVIGQIVIVCKALAHENTHVCVCYLRDKHLHW